MVCIEFYSSKFFDCSNVGTKNVTKINFIFKYYVDTDKEAEKLNESTEKPVQRKSLPDLDRYWKAVNDDPSDFTAWTYLLQYVEQEVIEN